VPDLPFSKGRGQGPRLRGRATGVNGREGPGEEEEKKKRRKRKKKNKKKKTNKKKNKKKKKKKKKKTTGKKKKGTPKGPGGCGAPPKKIAGRSSSAFGHGIPKTVPRFVGKKFFFPIKKKNVCVFISGRSKFVGGWGPFAAGACAGTGGLAGREGPGTAPTVTGRDGGRERTGA